MFSNRRNQNLKNLSAHLGTADWIWKIYRQLTQESWVIPLILSWHPWSYMERARGKCLNDLKRLFLDTTIWKFFCSKIPWQAYKSNVRVKWSLLDRHWGFLEWKIRKFLGGGNKLKWCFRPLVSGHMFEPQLAFSPQILQGSRAYFYCWRVLPLNHVSALQLILLILRVGIKKRETLTLRETA